MTAEFVGVNTLERPSQRHATSQTNSLMNVTISEDGRIKLPGVLSGLSPATYLPMVHLYASTLEACRILDRYRHALASDSTLHAQAPLTALTPSRQRQNLVYKREDQTTTRAYKVRGAVVAMAKALEQNPESGFLTVSTGNHALGVLKAAELLKPRSVRIAVPENTAACKLRLIQARVAFLQSQGQDAQVLCHGQTFDETRQWAKAQDKGEYYLDPYSDPWVVAGQGTIGVELFHQLAPLLERHPVSEVVVIAPVGGGGLLAGSATGLKMAAAWAPRFRNVDVRLVGLRLADVKGSVLGDAIRVEEIASVNRMLFDSWGISCLLISDTEMAQGVQGVLGDLGAMVEGASGATWTYATTNIHYQPNENRLVVCILSGGNVSQAES